MNNEIQENKFKFAYESLEAIRTRLLDLTMRNPLLSFKHPKGKSVQIIDEVPNQIADFLKSGKSFVFVPIPDPTKKQLIESGLIDVNQSLDASNNYPAVEAWAKKLGFNTSFELPMHSSDDKKHTDDFLQTLLYPAQLESRLRAIKSQAELSIEETGNNILFLVLGFLEWDEHDSEKRKHAPLFTLPVKLERGVLNPNKGAFDYSIKLLDDLILTNITLKEKLKNDFGLVLPDLLDEHTPEEYFALVESTILKHQPKWCLKRQASLVLLNFSKQAMYEDLNPSNWPKGHEIEQHPVIKRLFGGGDEYLDADYQQEYEIDKIEEINTKFPIIYDADSSQHSALIDAINGENLVIEGPPGSGKSQTITNLIAASINSGKRVLFVAEKMAALNVVKDRLDRAGLGEFCLELHSHKTNKLSILTSLLRQVEMRGKYATPQQLQVNIDQYEAFKSKLNGYVSEVNKLWKNTGLTIHEIMNKVVRLRNKTAINPEAYRIDSLNDAEITPIFRNEIVDNGLLLADIFVQVQRQSESGSIQDHYWYGVDKEHFLDFEQTELCDSLLSWNTHLQNLEEVYVDICRQLEIALDANGSSISQIKELKVSLCSLPELKGCEVFEAISFVGENLDLTQQVFQIYKDVHERLLLISKVFQKDFLTDVNKIQIVTNHTQSLRSLTDNPYMKIADFSESHNAICDLLSYLKQIQERFDLIKRSIPSELQDVFKISNHHFIEVKTLINMINGLPVDLWQYRNEVFDSPDTDAVLSQLAGLIEEAAFLHKELTTVFDLENLPDVHEIEKQFNILSNGGLFKFLSGPWRESKVFILGFVKKKISLKQIQNLIPKLIEYKIKIDTASQVSNKHKFIHNYYQGVDTPIDKMIAVREWYKAVRNEYGYGFAERVKIGVSLFTLDRELAYAISSDYEKELKTQIQKSNLLIQSLKEKFGLFDKNSNMTGLYLDEISGVAALLDTLEKALSYLSPALLTESIDLKTLLESSSQIKEVLGLNKQFEDVIRDSKASKLLQYWPLSIQLGSFDANLYKSGRETINLFNALAENSHIYHWMHKDYTAKKYTQLCASGQALKDAVEREENARAKFAKDGNVQLNHWLTPCLDTVASIASRNKLALNNPNWLSTWAKYVQIRNRLSKNGLATIISGLENKHVLPEMLADVIELIICHHLAKEVIKDNQIISEFGGVEQNAIIKYFREYDNEIIKLQRKQIAFNASRQKLPQGITTGRVGNFTELGLIKHEASKKTRHIAVRSLLDRASNSIQALKPCFMMSPMSVAQYLKPGHFNFDLVIMDEASQILPEDALGVIARGKSVVIVGDPKQLPPTRFFQSSNTVDDEAEDLTTLEETESILESVMSNFKTRRLRWHYRSKHESLIAFSNKHFYDSDLVLFPSPMQNSPEFGIHYKKVHGGRFNERRNRTEAEAVIKEAISVLLNGKNESVGIVAMNSQQRDEISMLLELAIKDNPSLQKVIESNQKETIFVKNLENVQGDERDVILISMTYGSANVGERVPQRFGPINSADGWKRLNVLFTRAKKRMHIFSSMSSTDILLTERSQKGVKALRAFLEYCESGHLNNSVITGKEPDSDFEIAVISALKEYGYECEPQLGVAGFFLDIAVRNPHKQGHFLLAIECDGATYHSAKSARDRDRLRQDILEGLGWEVCRIWSTDWFDNPDAQLKPILSRLAQLTEKYAEDEVVLSAPKADAETVILNTHVSPDEKISTNSTKSIPLSLRDELQLLADKIEMKLPHINNENRLLRPAMIEALVHSKPCTRIEFLERVPPYLREQVSADEGKYLNEVFDIVENHS